jgi:hypothetical protein
MFDNHFSVSLFLLFSYVLIIDHHLLFLFDHAISLKKKRKIIQHGRLSKSSSDPCVTREIAVVVVEITIQMMNSFSYTYIQKEKNVHMSFI